MNQTYLLDLRTSSIGGVVAPGRIAQFGASSDVLGSEGNFQLESEVTFLVHGYNVNRENGQVTLLGLAKLLRERGVNGAIVAVLWPGDSQTLGFASYPFESRPANDSAKAIAEFVQRVIKRSTKLSFVSHSLGARLVMKTVQLLKHQYAIGQICLMAAAIDDFSLAEPKNYRDAVLDARRVTVLASEADQVLKNAYPIGDWLQSFFDVDEVFGQALGLRGPKPTLTYGVPQQVYHFEIPSDDMVDHPDYLPAYGLVTKKVAAVAEFVKQVLESEIVPVYEIKESTDTSNT